MFAAIVLGVAGRDRCRRDRVHQRHLADAHYPIWSLTSIALGALVIYALAAYGGNAEAAQNDAGRALLTSAFRPSEITPRWVRKPTDCSNTI